MHATCCSVFQKLMCKINMIDSCKLQIQQIDKNYILKKIIGWCKYVKSSKTHTLVQGMVTFNMKVSSLFYKPLLVWFM